MLRSFIALLIAVMCGPAALWADDFHVGRGGFAITADAEDYAFASAADVVDGYRLYGYSFGWTAPHYKLLVSSWTVSITTGSVASETANPLVIEKRKEQIMRHADKLGFMQSPYSFEKQRGFELRSTSLWVPSSVMYLSASGFTNSFS